MREAEPPTSLFTAKQAISAFLIGSGTYSLYYSRFERASSGLKMMTICIGGLSIGFGVWQFAGPYLRKELAERERDEKSTNL